MQKAKLFATKYCLLLSTCWVLLLVVCKILGKWLFKQISPSCLLYIYLTPIMDPLGMYLNYIYLVVWSTHSENSLHAYIFCILSCNPRFSNHTQSLKITIESGSLWSNYRLLLYEVVVYYLYVKLVLNISFCKKKFLSGNTVLILL